MSKYRIGIDTRPDNVTAWVFDLPGCRSISGTREETLALVPVAIGEYLAWLDTHHARPLDAMEPYEYEIVEEITGSGDDLCFEDDRSAVDSDELERGISYIGFAHADLASLLRPLTPTVWSGSPGHVGEDRRNLR